MKPTEKKRSTIRIAVACFFLFLCFSVVIGKAIHIQVVLSPDLSEKAAGQYEKTLTIRGKRGHIRDANLREMAITIDATSIGAYPKKIAHPESLSAELARELKINPKEVRFRLSSEKPFVWVKRQVTPKEKNRIQSKQWEGIAFLSEHSRFYPNRSLAAQVIGFTGTDGNGIDGLEFYYDAYLKGGDHRYTVLRDAMGKRFDADMDQDMVYSGNTLILTIDQTIQFITEQALEEAVTAYNGRSGMAIVMDPKTGAVLAMANFPFFNPNAPNSAVKEARRNRIVTDPFEPGSTMKIFTAASAMEYGGCTPNTVFFCENGKYRIGRNVVHDTGSFGWLSIQKIIKHSSNIGAVKMSEMVGAKALYTTLARFGFGKKTGIDCPGETAGTLLPFQRWTHIDTSAISFGHGISVSPIQLITAVSAIANNGIRMKPYLVRAMKDPTGRVIKTVEPQEVGPAVSPETASAIKEMMRSAVEEGGTGVQADLEDYPVCGKTGTARKISKEGFYTDEAHTASFVGFTPMADPRIVVLVIIDEPRGKYYGGVVAAPVFRKIAHETLNYLNIPPQGSPEQHFTAQTVNGVNG